MKTKFAFLTIFMLLLYGCNLGITPPVEETQEPAKNNQQPTDTQSPVAEDTSTPALVTIDLAGPPMEVGSRYTYVDGAILVAVPG
ncbi:MAG: hypothetical protein HC797_05785, partial [Anaerolineales bacterium]|nr:hypothetical protein [Anaerolineales bacterium]